MVHDSSEIAGAIRCALEDDTAALVERYVAGVELTVAVLGNDDPVALPTVEIVPKNEFYDYESKYAPGGCKHIIPARISPEATEACQRLSVTAHRALGCRGVSRTDMILDPDGAIWLLETNTIPGMTSASLLPDTAKKAGISYPELCRLLVEYALEDSDRSMNPQAKVRP